MSYDGQRPDDECGDSDYKEEGNEMKWYHVEFFVKCKNKKDAFSQGLRIFRSVQDIGADKLSVTSIPKKKV
jgi:hypothetical protein